MRATGIWGSLLLCLLAGSAAAQESNDGYQLNPGDVVQISVWKEAELSREVLVLPDGTISFPLVGELSVAGRTPDEVRAALIERLEQFVPDASVTVAVLNPSGNLIYVIGKVARPGEFVANRRLDVMQALAMAGGMTAFANENKVKILRRTTDGAQRVIDFRYSDVKEGRDLDSNILLQSGDVVVVP